MPHDFCRYKVYQSLLIFAAKFHLDIMITFTTRCLSTFGQQKLLIFLIFFCSYFHIGPKLWVLLRQSIPPHFDNGSCSPSSFSAAKFHLGPHLYKTIQPRGSCSVAHAWVHQTRVISVLTKIHYRNLPPVWLWWTRFVNQRRAVWSSFPRISNVVDPSSILSLGRCRIIVLWGL